MRVRVCDTREDGLEMPRIARYILIMLLLAVIAVSLFACTDKDYGVIIDDEEATVDGVVDIALTSVKDTYYLGEFFDRSQYTVKAILNTGKAKDIPFDDSVKVEGFNSFEVGSNTFTIRYGAATTTYTINVVEPEIASIELATMPTKTSYIEGEKLNVDGCTLNITLKNTGAVVNVGITSGFVTGFDSVEMGKKDLIINFCGTKLELPQAVEVRPKSLVSVTVEKMPTVTEYLTGDTKFERAGMVLLFTYDNDEKELVDVAAISEDDLTFDFQFSSAHSQSPVVGTYKTMVQGEEKTFTIIIYCSVSDKILRSNNAITLVQSPTVGTQLLEGSEDMDYTGGKLRVHYQDNVTYDDIDMTSPIFTKNVYKDAEGTIPADLSKPGKYYVRFSYYRNDSRNWYYNLEVEVVEKEAIAMTLTNTEEAVFTKYYAGLDTKVNINDLKYVLSYNNNTKSEPLAVTESMLVAGSTLSVVDGAGSIDIANNAITLSSEQYVIEGDVIKSQTGEDVGSIDKSHATFSIDNDVYTYDEQGIVYGYKRIAFAQDGVSAVLKVMIYKEEVISINIITPPTNAFLPITATTLGNMSGLSIRVKYNHGGEETVSLPEDGDVLVTFADGSTTLAGNVASLPADVHYAEHTLYVSYKGCSTTVDGRPISFKVYFTDLDPAFNTLITNPTIAYIYGDKVRLLGMQFSVDIAGSTQTLTVVKDDDTAKLVTFMIDGDDTNLITLSKSAFVASDNYAVTTTGEYTFNYFGAQFSTTMTVTPLAVSSIAVIDVSSIKTVYNVGEPLGSLDGIKLSVSKNNGSSEDVVIYPTKITSTTQMYRNGYYYMFADDVSTAGAKTVTFYYKENTNIVHVDYKGILYKDGSYEIAELQLFNDKGASLYDEARGVYDLGTVAAGMSLNLAGYRLHVTYAYEGQTKEETINVEQSMLNYTIFNVTDEEREVILTYNDITLKLVVYVVKTDLAYIRLDVDDLQKDYIVGSTFSYDGGYIQRFYNGQLPQDSVPLSEGKVTGFDSNITFSDGVDYVIQTLTVEYGANSNTFEVRIWNRLKLDTSTVTFDGMSPSFGTGKEPTVKIAVPSGVTIFEVPTYTLRYQYQRPDGRWEYIDSNNGVYTYYIDRNSDGSWVYTYTDNAHAHTYQSRDMRPHHVGTYRVVFTTEGNEFYEAVTDDSISSLFTIMPYSIGLVADSKVVAFGDPKPALTFSVTGNGIVEQFAVKDLGINYVGELALDGDGVNVDTYGINMGTLAHPYFTITFESSTYTVTPKELIVTPVDLKNIHFTGDDRSGIILFDVKTGSETLVTAGNCAAVADYFSVVFTKEDVATDLIAIGDYKMVLTAKKGASGNYNYIFRTGETTSYTLTYDVTVRKKLRTLTITSSDVVSVAKSGDQYVFTFVFSSTEFADLDSLAWSTTSDGYTVANTVTNNKTITLSVPEGAQYQVFYFKYYETAEYEASGQVRVDVSLANVV